MATSLRAHFDDHIGPLQFSSYGTYQSRRFEIDGVSHDNGKTFSVLLTDLKTQEKLPIPKISRRALIEVAHRLSHHQLTLDNIEVVMRKNGFGKMLFQPNDIFPIRLKSGTVYEAKLYDASDGRVLLTSATAMGDIWEVTMLLDGEPRNGVFHNSGHLWIEGMDSEESRPRSR